MQRGAAVAAGATARSPRQRTWPDRPVALDPLVPYSGVQVTPEYESTPPSPVVGDEVHADDAAEVCEELLEVLLGRVVRHVAHVPSCLHGAGHVAFPVATSRMCKKSRE